jgi:hypothetical protein
MQWVREQVQFELPAQDYTRLDYLHEVEHANDRVRRLEEAIGEAVKLVLATVTPYQCPIDKRVGAECLR